MAPPSSIVQNTGLMPKRSRDTTRRLRREVEDHDRPHSLETREATLAPFLVGGERDLGVAGGAEYAPLRFQLTAKYRGNCKSRR